MKLAHNSCAQMKFASHDPDVDNTAAVATIAAIAGERHVITRVDFSYDGDGAGELTVTDGTDTWKVFVTKGGPGPIEGTLDSPIFVGAAGAAVTVTLSAVASVKGTVNVGYF